MKAETSQNQLRFKRVLWLMPAAYAVHIAEEFFAGFQRYIAADMGGPPMSTHLFVQNSSGNGKQVSGDSDNNALAKTLREQDA